MSARAPFIWLCLLALLAGPLAAAQVVRVPEDAALADALELVDEGGIVDIAPGTYTPPPGGWSIAGGRAVTVRARLAGTVVLDGGGSGPILSISGGGSATLRFPAFEGITFARGSSDEPTLAGGVTIVGARAAFVNCTFTDNWSSTTSLSGGAVQVRDDSHVRFTRSRFLDNRARQWGAAIYAYSGPRVELWACELRRNRTNLPGHGALSAGGAIYANDSQLSAFATVFAENQAAFAGGAIYATGTWREPVSQPSTRVELVTTLFRANAVVADPCCAVPGAPAGGAIHVEDHTTLAVDDSHFLENVATWGGAISSYRARVEIEHSALRGNRVQAHGGDVPAGGAINLTSADFADASTGYGAFNRRPAELEIDTSLVQGRYGTTGAAAVQGGCLFAGGDSNRMTGSGVPRHGTASENRAKVRVTSSVFFDCDAASSAQFTGLGGAFLLLLGDLDLASSLVAGADALGNGTFGGGLLAMNESAVRLTDSTFARNSATWSGGAVRQNGGSIDVVRSSFLDNDVSPGINEPIASADASALALAPGTSDDIVGRVEDSLFSGNRDLTIVDTDFTSGRANRVVYNGNRIHATSFGPEVYKNLAVGFGGLTVAQLNTLSVPHSGGTTVVKSTRANSFEASAPRTGALLAAPARLGRRGAQGEAAPTTWLGYAASGGSGAIGTQSLPAAVGLLEVSAAGSSTLTVAGTPVASAAVAARPCGNGRVACLNDERFLAEIDWLDFTGRVGNAGLVVTERDSAVLSYFDPDVWEVLIKVLDGCALTNHFWVFAAATTNVEHLIRVTDTVSGVSRAYHNPLGTAAPAITDTFALAACGAGAPGSSPLDSRPPVPPEPTPGTVAPREVTACVPGPNGLCLAGGRFLVTVEWTDFQGGSGRGTVVPIAASRSGLFWFFAPQNWELMIKVLDGCALNSRFWVFAAATTNVEYHLTVTDTVRQVTRRYDNPLGRSSPAITDTGAFATCP